MTKLTRRQTLTLAAAAGAALLGLDRAGYAQLARNSVESSFATDELKDPRFV